MIMYYFYERLWATVSWGKYDPGTDQFRPMSLKDRIIWTTSALVVIGFIFLLIFYVSPLLGK